MSAFVAVKFFDLIYINVVAARVDDDIFRAADDVEPPVGVEAPEVARVQPTVLQNFVGRGLIAIVAGHHVGAVHQQLADIALAVELHL